MAEAPNPRTELKLPGILCAQNMSSICAQVVNHRWIQAAFRVPRSYSSPLRESPGEGVCDLKKLLWYKSVDITRGCVDGGRPPTAYSFCLVAHVPW
jgi:hypothetical protein